MLLGPGGMDAFTAQYGDYYVGGITLGGDSGVLVSQDMEETSIVEKLKIEITVELLLFSVTETIADEAFMSAHSDLKFGITAFDTLTGGFVNLPKNLGLDEKRRLGAEYSQRTEGLAERINKRLETWETVLSGDTKLSWNDIRGIMDTGMVVEMLLLPFAKLREVRPFALGAAGGSSGASTPVDGGLVLRSLTVETASA